MDDFHSGQSVLGDASAEFFDLRQWLQVIIDRWWVVCLTLLVGIVLSVFLLSQEKPNFRASTVLFIQEQRERVLNDGLESVRDESIRTVDMINTIVDSLNSYSLAERVVQKLNLSDDPSFIGAVNWDSEKRGVMSPATAAGQLGKLVKATFREKTRLIDVVANTPDAALSTKLANGVADEYLRTLIEQSLESSKSASKFLVEEAERLGEKMRLAEEAMQSFRERERATSLESMLSESQEKINTITQEIQQTNALLRVLQTDLMSIAGAGFDMSNLMRLPSVSGDSRVVKQTEKISELEKDLEDLARRYREGHPMRAGTKANLDVLRNELSQLLILVSSELEDRRSKLEINLQDLNVRRSEEEQRLLAITGKTVEYNKLSRDLETDRALYDSVLSRLKEVSVTSGLENQSITIRERSLGASATPSQAIKLLIMGVIGGACVGVAAALGLSYLDPTLKTIDQVERSTRKNVIAAVPYTKITPIKEEGASRLPVVGDRHSLLAEAYRTMRATLAMTASRQNKQVYLITSAIPGEGKTFTSANFAATLAQQGYKTLLLDADLRKPALAKLLYGKNLEHGLAEVLGGFSTSDAVTDVTKLENLSFISSGQVPLNPAELLSMPSFAEFIGKAKERYEKIVIDSAPVLAVRDALLIAQWADVICLLVRSGATPCKATQQAIRVIEDADYTVTGIVLNAFKQRTGGYYAYAYRSYGNYRADDSPIQTE
jgi:capsular exopolysaccharide synthesis family protein